MPSASWTVESDVLAAGDLRITVQRIALDQVREPGTLRSWGLAPLHRDGDEVLVPCAPGEALWIGAWMEESSSIGRARVTDPVSGHSGTLALPRDYQLALLRHEGSEPEPLPERRCDATNLGSRACDRHRRRDPHTEFTRTRGLG